MPNGEQKEKTREGEPGEVEDLTDTEMYFIGEMKNKANEIHGIDQDDLRYFQREQASQIYDEFNEVVHETRDSLLKERRGWADVSPSVKKTVNGCREEIKRFLRVKEEDVKWLRELKKKPNQASKEQLSVLALEEKAEKLIGYEREIKVKGFTEEETSELMADIENVKEVLRGKKRDLIEKKEEEERKRELERLRGEIKDLTE